MTGMTPEEQKEMLKQVRQDLGNAVRDAIDQDVIQHPEKYMTSDYRVAFDCMIAEHWKKEPRGDASVCPDCFHEALRRAKIAVLEEARHRISDGWTDAKRHLGTMINDLYAEKIP